MMGRSSERAIVVPLAIEVRHLIRIAGAIAGSDEGTVRAVMIEAVNGVQAKRGDSVHSRVDSTHSPVDPVAVDEIILQSYLFAGFPRALNAARTWRSISGTSAPERDADSEAADLDIWRERGLRTCETVYGDFYEPLRRNIKSLHPVLDEWMIVDGYGKVLSRPGVDLRIRELCVVAACAVAGQQRQLHSHFHGALNAGATPAEIGAVLDALDDLVSTADLARYRQLFLKVQAQ